ncbi:MAG TPA: DUF4214 domain-containing protein [Pyrinomonadaceae bacterium]|nr:DUF4214 domain-containing protein [Pyrinomonadaceae bacterium]
MRQVTLSRRSFNRLVFALTLALSAASGARAQTEEWIHARPEWVVPEKLSVFTCDGVTTASAGWIFNSGGYRVEQPPVVSRSGQTVTLDVRAEEWTGVRTLSIIIFEKDFELGVLEPGNYTLDVQSWGSPLKQIQFTVRQPQPAAARLDDGCFFVSQHYRDFLSREPDGAGLAFWTDELASCGHEAACAEVKRINVSGAFFLSIEFRETGYFVYRAYKAAFGRAPTFAEFAPDAARVGSNLVVGGVKPWLTILDGNKRVFMRAFADRPEFVARYDGLTTAQYVDKLFETAGVTPTRAERDEMIRSVDDCPSTSFGCPTRATLLRGVVEHPALDRKLFNEAFVHMQYFGYLRRDPDPDGLNFWRAKLDQFHGNYVAAELVKAFLNSDEYRHRFGQ